MMGHLSPIPTFEAETLHVVTLATPDLEEVKNSIDYVNGEILISGFSKIIFD